MEVEESLAFSRVLRRTHRGRLQEWGRRDDVVIVNPALTVT
jgi:hypothetical protein